MSLGKIFIFWKKTPKHEASVFSNNLLISFRKNIRETLVPSSLSKDSSSQNGTPFLAGLSDAKRWFYSATIISAPKSQYNTISRAPPPISFTASHGLDVACCILKKSEDLWGQGLVSIGVQSLAMIAASCQTRPPSKSATIDGVSVNK
jgi:hypothetical protein